MCWLIIIFTILLILFLVWASADVASNVYLKTICKADVKEKVLTLTFDDGPDKINTPKVLDVLKKYNIQATFFLIGAKVEQNADIVKRIVEEGNIVANHTYSHGGYFPLCSRKKVELELTKCAESIYKTIGKYPKLFRPPFGVTNPIIGKVVTKLKFNAIGWSVRSLDTIENKTREEISNRVAKMIHPGAIILLHDRCKDADKLLESIIEYALKNDYSFITLDKMINVQAYEN